MKTTIIFVLVAVILLIRWLAKLGGATGGDAPRSRPHKKAGRPPRHPQVSRGASGKSPSAPAKPGKPVSPKVRRPIFGRRTSEPTTAPPLPPPQGPGSETYVRYLIDVLRVGEPAASRQAVERLVEIGRPALATLQETARDPSPFVRERVQQASRQILERLALPGAPRSEAHEEADALVLPPPAPAREPRPAVFEKREPDPAPEPEPVLAEPPEPEPEPESSEPPEPEPPSAAAVDWSDVESLATVLRSAAAESGLGGGRDAVLEPLKDQIVHFTVLVDRVQWSGTFGISADYRGGRTVAGKIPEADLPVAVCLPAARNAYADQLKEGATFAFRGVFAGWDGMYDRGKFEGDLVDEPE